MTVKLQHTGEIGLRVTASMCTLVIVALVLRAIARVKTKYKFSMEDFLIIVATAFFFADQGLFLYAVLGKGASGGSDAFKMGSLDQLNRFFKYLYVQEILFVLTITMVKYSILIFYTHVFAIRKFLIATWVVMGICTLWAITTIFLVIFQCKPIRAVWTFEIQAASKCIPAGQLIFGFELSNVVIDLIMLAMPIYMVQNLQLNATRKASIIGIFALGGFVCVTCIVRAWYIFDPKTKLPRSLPASMDWSSVELACAIVCACLPIYGPLLSSALIPPIIKSWYDSLVSSLRSTQRSTKATEKKQYGNSGDPSQKVEWKSYNQIQDTSDTLPMVNISGGIQGQRPTPSEPGSINADYNKNIEVRRSVEIV